MDQHTKVRTTGELSVLIEAMGAILFAVSVVALFFVRHFFAVLIIIAVPAAYVGIAWLVINKMKNAVMINIIDSDGVRNSFFGNTVCEMGWDEIGDFGVTEVTGGFFSGKYIYLSRIFVQSNIRKDIIKKYDPRVCIVFPCTEEICRTVLKTSGGKIDIR